MNVENLSKIKNLSNQYSSNLLTKEDYFNELKLIFNDSNVWETIDSSENFNNDQNQNLMVRQGFEDDILIFTNSETDEIFVFGANGLDFEDISNTNNKLFIFDSKISNVNTAGGDDEIYIYNSTNQVGVSEVRKNFTLFAGDGDDTIIVENSSLDSSQGGQNLTSGDGDDTFITFNSFVKGFDLGDGDDSAILKDSKFKLSYAGAGDDTLLVEKSEISGLHTHSGSDEIYLDNSFTHELNTFEDDDKVEIYNNSLLHFLFTSQGNDNISVNSSELASLDSGINNDFVSLLRSYLNSVSTGDGVNKLNSSFSNLLNVSLNYGVNLFTSDNDTIGTISGNDQTTAILSNDIISNIVGEKSSYTLFNSVVGSVSANDASLLVDYKSILNNYGTSNIITQDDINEVLNKREYLLSYNQLSQEDNKDLINSINAKYLGDFSSLPLTDDEQKEILFLNYLETTFNNITESVSTLSSVEGILSEFTRDLSSLGIEITTDDINSSLSEYEEIISSLKDAVKNPENGDFQTVFRNVTGLEFNHELAMDLLKINELKVYADGILSYENERAEIFYNQIYETELLDSYYPIFKEFFGDEEVAKEQFNKALLCHENKTKYREELFNYTVEKVESKLGVSYSDINAISDSYSAQLLGIPPIDNVFDAYQNELVELLEDIDDASCYAKAANLVSSIALFICTKNPVVFKNAYKVHKSINSVNHFVQNTLPQIDKETCFDNPEIMMEGLKSQGYQFVNDQISKNMKNFISNYVPDFFYKTKFMGNGCVTGITKAFLIDCSLNQYDMKLNDINAPYYSNFYSFSGVEYFT